jgi:hypothetical protein
MPLWQTSHVVMRLDHHALAFDADALDDIRVKRTLDEAGDILQLLCVGVEDLDEVVPDDLGRPSSKMPEGHWGESAP